MLLPDWCSDSSLNLSFMWLWINFYEPILKPNGLSNDKIKFWEVNISIPQFILESIIAFRISSRNAEMSLLYPKHSMKSWEVTEVLELLDYRYLDANVRSRMQIRESFMHESSCTQANRWASNSKTCQSYLINITSWRICWLLYHFSGAGIYNDTTHG